MRLTRLLAVVLLSACTAAPRARLVAPPPVVVPPPGAVAPAVPPAPPPRAERIRTVEGITEYRLPNGLQVLLFPDDTKSTVTVNVTYFVGSRHEGYGETGMAHLLEHMTFKGTEQHGELLAALETRGAFTNGTTWFDRTNYFETLPATGDNLAFALELEAARMRQSKLDPADLATEFSVVRNEFEIGENDPFGVLMERVSSAAYLWHNYGKSTIGSRSDIERVPIDNLRAFYDRYYQPDNAMLVVAGRFDTEAALAEIERTFGAIPRPSRALVDSYTVEPVQDGERTVTLRRAGDLHLLLAAYHVVPGAHPDHAAVSAALDLLTREPSGRLYGPLVKKKLASAVFGFTYALREPGLAFLGAQVRDAASVEPVKKALLAAVEGLGATAITDEEVARYRVDALNALEQQLADSQALAVELSEWAAMGDWRLVFAHRERLKALTAAEVRRAAATWFKPSNRTLGEFIPTRDADRAPPPSPPDVAALAAAVKEGAVDAGEAFVASLDNLEARTILRTLDGGIAAAMLPKQTRGSTVRLSLTLRHGDVDSLRGKRGLGAATAALVQRGTTTRSYQQLQDEASRLKADIGISGGEGALTVSIETVRDSLGQAVELALEMLRAPALPADELEVIRQQVLAGLEQQLQDPASRGFNALQRAVSPWPAGDPREVPELEAEVARWKKLSLAEVRAYHKAFWGAGAGELVVVGDFDADDLAARVQRGLAGWTAAKPYRRVEDKRFGVPGREVRLDLRDKEMAMLAVAHDLDLRDDDPAYVAAQLAAFTLGGSLGSRLWTRLREREGFSYGTGAWITADRFDRVGSLGAYAMVAPQNLARARAALLEELSRFAADGTDEAELARMKQAYREQALNGLADDGGLVGTLGGLLYEGRTLAHVRAELAAVDALTVAQVSAAAKALIETGRLVIVEAGDLGKAK
jgi:zinc protease